MHLMLLQANSFVIKLFYHLLSEMGLHNCHYLKLQLAFKSRLPIPEFSGYHCSIFVLSVLSGYHFIIICIIWLSLYHYLYYLYYLYYLVIICIIICNICIIWLLSGYPYYLYYLVIICIIICIVWLSQ